MKIHRSLLLPTLALLTLSAGIAILPAGESKQPSPEPAKPAKPASPGAEQKAGNSPLISAEVRTEAATAIERDVMWHLRSEQELRELYSRALIPRRSDSFNLAYTEAAPGGVKIDTTHLPFEVRQTSANQQPGEQPRLFLSGFYDANTKTVQLYSTAAKGYVAAVEHPYIKARMPKK